MKVKRERKNVIEFVNEKIVRKISIVQEKTRPHRLKVEAWALSQAREQGINVPCVMDYYRDAEGREVLVLERIHGGSLSLNRSKETIDCIFDVGRQMASLLLNDASVNYGWIDPINMTGKSRSWLSFISSYTQAYGEPLVKEKIIKESHLQKVCRAIKLVKPYISVPFLVNGDIRLPHIIKDVDGKIWILDWENVIVGDPLWDLALFGIRYGHGALWQNLRLGYGFSSLPKKYTLYEIIALIGIIDFFRKNKINYYGKLRKFMQLVNSF
jgi:hypothetical protein